MTFQKDETGILQTSVNAAATLTAAEMNAGIIKSHDGAAKRLGEYTDSLFEKLNEARIRDNEMFKAEEAAAPAKPRSGGRGKSTGSTGGGDIDDPGSVAFKGKGKFAGRRGVRTDGRRGGQRLLVHGQGGQRKARLRVHRVVRREREEPLHAEGGDQVPGAEARVFGRVTR
jgi:hypothetical protein